MDKIIVLMFWLAAIVGIILATSLSTWLGLDGTSAGILVAFLCFPLSALIFAFGLVLVKVLVKVFYKIINWTYKLDLG